MKLCGCTYFSKLDFKSAFHQIEIDEPSQYVTVFHVDKLMDGLSSSYNASHNRIGGAYESFTVNIP